MKPPRRATTGANSMTIDIQRMCIVSHERVLHVKRRVLPDDGA